MASSPTPPGQIYTSNISRLTTKLHTIVSQGQGQLKVVTDFDATLSSPGWSSWCVFEKRQDLSLEYRNAIVGLVNQYYPKEIDPNLTQEERVESMLAWRHAAVELLKNERITEELYHAILSDVQDYISLRPGAADLLTLTHKLDIPVLVFSAGLFDVVDALLTHSLPAVYQSSNPYHPVYTPSSTAAVGLLAAEESVVVEGRDGEQGLSQKPIRIIANHCLLGDIDRPTSSDHVRGVIGLNPNLPSIHVYNKDERIIQSESYFELQIAPRSTAFVMGDSLGDATMLRNNISDNHVIRVGFLNLSKSKTIESHLEKYLDVFDIVFVDSNYGIQWVHDIITQMVAEKPVQVLNKDEGAPSIAPSLAQFLDTVRHFEGTTPIDNTE